LPARLAPQAAPSASADSVITPPGAASAPTTRRMSSANGPSPIAPLDLMTTGLHRLQLAFGFRASLEPDGSFLSESAAKTGPATDPLLSIADRATGSWLPEPARSAEDRGRGGADHFDPDDLRITCEPVGEGVVRLTVNANAPDLAVAAATAVVEVAAEQLRTAVIENAKRRIGQIRPEVDRLRLTLDSARDEIDRFRATTGRQDPSGLAVKLERDLSDLHAEREAVEVLLSEQKAAWSTIIARIKEMEAEQIGQVIEHTNPRFNELKSEISELEAQYNSMTTMTDRHPDKQGVLQALEAKRRELVKEQQVVVERTVREPSAEYVAATTQMRDLDTELARLGERSRGLAVTELDLKRRIDEVSQAATELDLLLEARSRAEAAWQEQDAVLRRLETIAADTTRYSFLRPLDPPSLSSAGSPVRPVGWIYLGFALGLGLVGGSFVCATHAAARQRVLCRWQYDDLAARLGGVTVLADLPSETASPSNGVVELSAPD
ncbi:MAG: hypothetical protein ACOC0P_06500, partial [Planctomycetota bacterium]